MCPYYLDGDLEREHGVVIDAAFFSVIPNFIGYCAVFKVREEAKPLHRSPGN